MRFKVCCIASADEARIANEAGAELLGLVSQNLSGAGAIPDDRIRTIAESLPVSASPCLLTSAVEPASIVEHVRSTRVRAVQLVGEISPEDVRSLRPALPGVRLVKVVHVEGPRSIESAWSYGQVADCLLLDSAVRRVGGDSLGGTGKTHDWGLSREITKASAVPVFLAGGLNPQNVASAISEVCPDGVDVCSGLRIDGALQESLVTEFVARATAAAV